MKKIFYFISTVVLALGITSCDAIFDSLEGDLTKMSGEDLVSSEAGLDRLMANLYSSVPMGAFAELDKNTPNATSSDGSGSINNSITGFWSYSTMRSINMVIQNIENAYEKGVISESVYKSYLGEATFIRAYCYFASVRVYGGVPIVTKPLDDQFGVNDNQGLYVKRSTEKETWDFVLSEFDKAAELLPETRTTGIYRATKWSALGLKSRAALYAASVSKYWNNAPIEDKYTAVKEKLTYMDASYANDYYQQCIDACEKIINSGKFALYMPTPNTVAEATKNYSDIFLSRINSEWIFGRSYENGVTTNSNGIDLKNSPNQAHGSGTGVWKFGQFGVSLDMVDEYDRYTADFGGVNGKIKTRTDGKENEIFETPSQASGVALIKKVNFIKYATPDAAFADKDARFYASVIYPDIVFRGKTIKIQGGIWKSNGDLKIYDESNPSETVNGTTYYSLGASNTTDCSGFYYFGKTNDGSWYTTGFGLRKWLDYTSAPSETQNPYYDMRYTEVLLNYCEAQVEKNGTNAGKSQEYLNAIRRRANFRDQRDATLANVMHERRVELAFEDDYSYTLRRRRENFNQARDMASNPNGGRIHALVPVVDLSHGEPGYIFIRANAWGHDVDRYASPFSTSFKSYYGSISNYIVNEITPNPIQEN